MEGEFSRHRTSLFPLQSNKQVAHLTAPCLPQIKKAAQKRKEEDADFEEKRMILGITVDDNDDENDKENLARRRELMRSRLEKDLIFDEDESRYRRGGDIVSRWRDKRPTSPVQFKVRLNTRITVVSILA